MRRDDGSQVVELAFGAEDIERSVFLDRDSRGGSSAFDFEAIESQSTAYLQYTSGSTRQPLLNWTWLTASSIRSISIFVSGRDMAFASASNEASKALSLAYQYIRRRRMTHW